MTAVFVSAYRLTLWQIDSTSTYLNSDIKEDVCIKQPSGHEESGKEDWVCKLLKTLYQTKQGAANWWNELNEGFDDIRYYTSTANPCIHLRWDNSGNITITNTYTDDVFGASSNPQIMHNAKAEIEHCYKIKDVGEIQKFLRLKVIWNKDNHEISFSQQHYIQSFLAEFGLQGVNT